ncbi:MAG: BREX system Lon protease-like protein BrxL [Chloroflexota bacterium]
METFEQKALDHFGSLIINKSFARKAGFGSRAIPVYVREWIVANYVGDSPDLMDDARTKIADFVRKYVPDKSDRETIKNRLYEQNDVKLLDDYSVYVDLAKGDRHLIIPFLDESKASIPPNIVRDNEMLLSSGLWGVGTLSYAPPTGNGPGQVILRAFTPFQLASLDLEFFISRRKEFTTQEWINLIVNSMGFNHRIYSERQKLLLISRLIPMVEPRFNLIELAPKATGKSFVFENMSRYVSVRSGAISAPVLFYNDSRKTPGLITRFDSVVIDEAQKVKGDKSGELTALLKSYLEAGRFGRGSAGSITAEAGIVILANIELDENKRPLHETIGLFRDFPNFLRETAFLDRFSGLLPGWDLPRISKDTPSICLGLKGDIFGEILHMLRADISYRDFVKTNMHVENCDDMRDSKNVESGATGLLKILFPDKQPSEQDFYHYCVNPAIEFRQRVRDELCKLDREYLPITMRSIYPDDFQKTHRAISYVDPDNIQIQSVELPSESEEIHPDEIADLPIRMTMSSLGTDEQSLTPNTIQIKEDESGYSYQNLFASYLKGARSIKVIDPYVRLEYQIRNFISFIGIIDTSEGPVHLSLTTSADDAYQEREISKKLDEIKSNVVNHGVELSYDFSQTVHRRGIEADNGWKIITDRGLDIFQKPDSRYELSEIDQTKRKCRETEIIYMNG